MSKFTEYGDFAGRYRVLEFGARGFDCASIESRRLLPLDLIRLQ